MGDVAVSEQILRMLLTFFLSISFGLERQFRKKPVGFGTFTFVATGSCLLTLVAIELSKDTPIPMLGGIITGIGFLGAGALLKYQEKKVFGFTTASSIWGFAALGIAIGSGLFLLGFIFYGVIIFVITLDHYFEMHSFGLYSRTLVITAKNANIVKEIEKIIPKIKVNTSNFNLKGKEHVFSINLSGTKEQINGLISHLLSRDDIIELKID